MPIALADAFDALAAAGSVEYKHKPYAWMCNEVRTQDEARKRVLVPWPAEREDVADAVRFMMREKQLAFPKSRRQFATWTVAAYVTHQARFFAGVAVYWQSRVESLSSFAIQQRCRYIEENQRNPGLRQKFKSESALHLEYPNDSRIIGVAQGRNALRGPTPTIVVLDETEFWDDAAESLNSAIAFLEGDAQVILLSSANGPSGVLAKIAAEAGFTRFVRA